MIIDRVLQIIDYKSINKRKFYLETGLSNGFLDKVKDIGASKIEIILSTFPDISPEWLISGKGDMVRPNQPEVSISNREMTLYERMLEKKDEEIANLNQKIGKLEQQLNSMGAAQSNTPATGGAAQAS